MKLLCTLAVWLVTIHCYAQPANTINIGKIDTVRSSILGETRRILVHVPASANNPLFTQTTYPVLYLLDGPAHFNSVTGMVQQLSVVNGNSVLPEMIIVGIQNTDRTRDLTPTKSTASPYGQTAEMLKTSGGADNFLSFIEKELMPYVDSTYPVAPYRMLAGHSFGGLFVMHTLLSRPELFSAYVALDPSLWWDNQVMVKRVATALQQNSFANKPFYLAIANTLNTQNDIREIEKDTSEISLGMRSAFQVAQLLDRHKTAYQPWHWKYYADDNHGSVPLIGQYDALRTFFKGHQMELPADPNAMEASIFINHYKKISTIMGYPVYPSEMRVNRMAYTLMQMGRMDQAFEFFKLNTDNYPNSFVVYDSMGDFYLAKGEKDKAIDQFKKALTLREYPETRQKLNKLTSSK